jgi:hypothetical protein
MTLSHSPNIVRDGLVLYYDMDNTKKSFKGMPTTNVMQYPEANWNGSSIPLSYNHDATSTRTINYITGVSNPINSPGILRYYTGTTGYRYFALRGTVPSAGTYTFSYYARMSNGASSSFGNNQLWRDTGVGDKSVTGDWNPVITNEWTRYVITSTVTNSLDFFPIHGGSIVGGYTIDYCGFQLEAGSIASPWLNGIRSNTQSLIDLTGNNTLTTSSLTYASDNTFSFNGSSNVIISPENSIFNTQTPSVSVWVKPNSLNQNGFWFEKGNVNTQYSLFQQGSNICWRQKQVGGGYSSLYVSGSGLSTSQWSNVVATYNSSNGLRKIYLNGNVIALDTSIFTIETNANGISMGAYGGFNGGRAYWYNGSIGLVSVYSKELAADQIKQNFNALRGRYGI